MAEDTTATTPAQEADALAGVGGERFDRVMRLTQAIFGTPITALNLVGEEVQHTVSALGVPRGTMPVEESICQYTVQQPDIFEVRDLRSDPRFATNPVVIGPPRLRFYAGVPLTAPSGRRVGALCVLDRVPRQLGPVEHEMLADLGQVLERELAIDAEMQHAGEVQRQLLPLRPPEVPGWEMAGQVKQFREAGGDFFDWLVIGPEVEGRSTVQVALADVMGKGLSAALISAETRAVLRTHSRYVGLGDAIQRTRETTTPDLNNNNAFVTMWAGRFDPVDGALTYVDAGHGLAAIASAQGARRLAQHYMPLGLPQVDDCRADSDVIAPDEVLAIVSDGVYDVFGSVDRAMAALQETVARGQPAVTVVHTIIEYAATHGATDDLTAVVVRRTGASTSGP